MSTQKATFKNLRSLSTDFDKNLTNFPSSNSNECNKYSKPDVMLR